MHECGGGWTRVPKRQGVEVSEPRGPAADPLDDALPETATEAVLPAEGPRQRIALAEDDPDFRELLGEALREEGYEVIEAADGTALAALLDEVHSGRRPPFDLVVSDVRMPGRSGVELLEWNYARDPDTRFLLVTAFGDPVLHARAAEFDVEVLDKPFELDEFLVRVRALVERWGELESHRGPRLPQDDAS